MDYSFIMADLTGNDTAKTLGERRVRITFNPSNNDRSFKLKTLAAQMINMLDEIRKNPPIPLEGEDVGEFNRLVSMAQTDAELASSNGVKALTIEFALANG